MLRYGNETLRAAGAAFGGGGRQNVLGPGTRKRTWARSGRVEAGFKAERVRENGSYLWSISQCCRRCAGVCAGAQAPGRVEAAAGFKPNRSESKRRGKKATGTATSASGCKKANAWNACMPVQSNIFLGPSGSLCLRSFVL